MFPAVLLTSISVKTGRPGNDARCTCQLAHAYPTIHWKFLTGICQSQSVIKDVLTVVRHSILVHHGNHLTVPKRHKWLVHVLLVPPTSSTAFTPTHQFHCVCTHTPVPLRLHPPVPLRLHSHTSSTVFTPTHQFHCVYTRTPVPLH